MEDPRTSDVEKMLAHVDRILQMIDAANARPHQLFLIPIARSALLEMAQTAPRN